MLVDTNIIIASNAFAGFQNYNFVSFSVVYAGANIGVGGFVGPIRAVTTLSNTNAISLVQVQYVGLDAFTRVIYGSITTDYTNTDTGLAYQIESFSYYSGGNLIVDSYISNQTGVTNPPVTVTIPPITFTCTAGLYQAPF